MSTTKQRLALSIVAFLSDCLEDGTLTSEDRESIEIAQSCIQDSFKVEPAPNVATDHQSLLQIYTVYENLRKSVPAAAAASSTPAATPSKEPTEEDKEQGESFKKLGNSYMAKKDYANSIEMYTKALSFVPGNPIYLSNRAAAYSASKDHTSAQADAEAAVAIDPKYTKAWSRLGLAKFALGDAKGSMEAYKKGIEYEGNGGSDAMKKGFETAKKRVEELGAEGEGDEVVGRGAPGAGAGGMPDLSALAGMFGGGGGGGGMPDLSSIMSNPMFANMAQSIMSNPEALSGIMNNPRLRELASQMGGAGGGGMPDLGSLMSDPSVAELARNLGAGAGRGRGSPPQ